MSKGEGTFMASDYDNQLIESVTVRRHRLLTALLYGENPNERRWMDSLRLFLLSIAAAAVIAAVCVGYSFVSNLLAENRAKQEEQAQPRQTSISWPFAESTFPETTTGVPAGTGA
ncbi:hypothetical protein ABIB35_003170 [Arthrobacter sp. UYP6]|uniref:hypothetical protein n=1 Tax=Arthrobacter sp. UYP6 TaxID=1756378 RepID=UPI00339729B6